MYRLLIVALAACGGAARPPPAPHPLTHPTSAPIGSFSAVPVVVDPLPSFEVIGKESLLQWPGTREGARQEGLAKDGLKVVVTATADTCVRAFVHATASVSVTLANSTTSLAEGKGNALALGGKGPVCVHKGDVLTVSVQGDARARVIVRQSP